jgi:hypothetical protein
MLSVNFLSLLKVAYLVEKQQIRWFYPTGAGTQYQSHSRLHGNHYTTGTDMDVKEHERLAKITLLFQIGL